MFENLNKRFTFFGEDYMSLLSISIHFLKKTRTEVPMERVSGINDNDQRSGS